MCSELIGEYSDQSKKGKEKITDSNIDGEVTSEKQDTSFRMIRQPNSHNCFTFNGSFHKCKIYGHKAVDLKMRKVQKTQCSYCHNFGHKEKECKNQNSQEKKGMVNVFHGTSYVWNNFGYKASQCRSRHPSVKKNVKYFKCGQTRCYDKFCSSENESAKIEKDVRNIEIINSHTKKEWRKKAEFEEKLVVSELDTSSTDN